MNLQKSLVFNIALALLIGSVVFFLSQEGYLTRPELASLDLSFRIRGALPFSPRLVVIEISDNDILQVGRWPWKRSWHAALTRALTKLGAEAIYFDIIFSEPATEEEDRLFEEAMKESKNVYLPFAFQIPSLDIRNAVMPLPRFAAVIKGTGAINIFPDIDGSLRRIPLVFLGKDNLYPHAALQIASDYLGMGIRGVTARNVIIGNERETIAIPVLKDNQMLINWSGKWHQTFKHYSFLEVLAAYQDILENKKPKINLADFKRSICVVGVTAIGLYDIKPVPVQSEYPGLGVMLNAMNNLLLKNFLHYPPAWVNILILFIMALVPAFLIFGEQPLHETVVVIIIGVIFCIVNLIFFSRGLRLDLFTPLAGLGTSCFAVGTYNFVRISVERQRFFKMSVTDGLTGLYNIRYFKLILETEIMLARNDPNKTFSIVMGDIDHFKHFNDTYGHQVGDLVLKSVAAILKNSVRALDIVARYGGEETIVLLRGTPLSYAMTVSEKMRKNIESCVVKDDKGTYKVTISMGVATFKAGDTVDTIVKRADDGLYRSKEAGRNRVSTVEVLV